MPEPQTNSTAIAGSSLVPCSRSLDVRECGDVTISRNGYIEQVERERDDWRYRAKAAERTVDNLNETIDRIKDQDIAVYASARAVVERWDTPLWKDAPATAGFINRLRAALSSET